MEVTSFIQINSPSSAVTSMQNTEETNPEFSARLNQFYKIILTTYIEKQE